MQIKFANKLQVHIADLMWNADKEMNLKANEYRCIQSK